MVLLWTGAHQIGVTKGESGGGPYAGTFLPNPWRGLASAALAPSFPSFSCCNKFDWDTMWFLQFLAMGDLNLLMCVAQIFCFGSSTPCCVAIVEMVTPLRNGFGADLCCRESKLHEFMGVLQ
jgi:hypothetical protein